MHSSLTAASHLLAVPRWVEVTAIAVTLVSYAALLSYVIPRHEPWADEAQAWELAKSLSLKALFGTYIHYEGSPGLWHVLLWFLTRMHVTYGGMGWVAGAIALSAMVLLTTAAPFPLPIRLIMPFTYFFVFQYAVVARSYVLFPVILFSLACCWPARQERPLPVVLLVGLLGNVSAHGFAVAVGLVLVLMFEWRRLPIVGRSRWKFWSAHAALLVIMLGFAAWCIMPARDAGWVVVAHRVVTASQPSGTSGTAWRSLQFLLDTARSAIYGLSIAFGPLYTHFRLGPVVWGLLIWVWARDGHLRYALSIPFLVALCGISSQFYHAGLVWVLFVFLWWITWPERKEGYSVGDPREPKWIRRALLVSVCLCLAYHLVWGYDVIRYEIAMPYSPDRDGAPILRSYLERGDRVVVAVSSRLQGDAISQYFVTGMEPYFASQPFNNMRFKFWFWGGDDDVRQSYLRDTEMKSAVVVVEETEWDQRYLIEERRLDTLGYRRQQVVCGQIFYPTIMSPPLCHAFYEPPNPSNSTR